MGGILVTGGAGFIGSGFVRGLCAGKWRQLGPGRVVVLDALTYAGRAENIDGAGAEFVHGSICDRDAVDEAMAGVDTVVHFAAESHVDRSVTGPECFVDTNIRGTHVLLDAAVRHGVKRFVHVSTDEVYGTIPDGAAPETAQLNPTSPYAASKTASDMLALAWHRTYGLPVMVTRCSNNYGPHQYPEKVIPKWVTRLGRGEPIEVHGDGKHARNWIHVDDHCRAIAAVLDSGTPGEVYNVSGTVELTTLELADLVLHATGANWGSVVMVPDRPANDTRYSVDDTRIRTELGWEPLVGFAEGLASTIAWYTRNPGWWDR